MPITNDKNDLSRKWAALIENPAREAGMAVPSLVVLKSPYRFVVHPILDYVLSLEQKNPDRQIAVLVPELVERHWYHFLLHNQRGRLLKELLVHKGDQRIIVIDLPWYLTA